MIIILDQTIELVQKTRILDIQGGPVLRTKNKRHDFKVQSLIVKWYEGGEPSTVVAHGRDEHGIGASRAFSLNHKKTPDWIKEALRATDA